jgi:hypothetical protein
MENRPKKNMNNIGTLKEKSLHAQIKEWYRSDGDRVEVPVERYIVDIVRNDLLIEIQTGNFSAIIDKYSRLLQSHRIRLIYPIIYKKIIKTYDEKGNVISERKSPKKGRAEDLFDELIRIPVLLRNDNFEIEILSVEVDEIRCRDGKGSWRRKGISIIDRNLVKVIEQELFRSPSDLRRFIPADLPEPFGNKELAAAIPLNVRKARKITYTLSRMGSLEVAEKRGNELLYTRNFLRNQR